jgi:RNA 3'-phosphate cyclase
MIEIDGGHLEGGGQIIRTTISLSAISSQSVRIFNIRKGRDKPGLRPQHYEGIVAAAKLCNANVKGVSLNSTEIIFIPRKISAGAYTIDTRTAGSVTLILQTLVPIGIYADSPVQLTLRGGTAVPFSPTVEYFRHVLCHMLKMIGVDIDIGVKKHGFYPRGGGEISVEISPGKLRSLCLNDPGRLSKVIVESYASQHLKKSRVAERMIDGFIRVIEDVETRYAYVSANSPGCFIASRALYEKSTIGADALGKRGRPAEDVGLDAARGLKETIESNAPIDEWMVDQIIPYMALGVRDTSKVAFVRVPCLTKHAETNIWVVEQLLPVKFDLDENVLYCRMA